MSDKNKWLQSVGLLYRLSGGKNCDEINVTMAYGSRQDVARADRAATVKAILENHDYLTASAERLRYEDGRLYWVKPTQDRWIGKEAGRSDSDGYRR